VDAGIGPVGFPAIEVTLRFFQALEAEAFEGSALGMTDSGLHFSLAIGILNATRKSQCTVVGQHVPVERIECGIVDVRDQHALAQVIEDHYPGGPA
jgi:hypothetical protein